MNHSILTTLRRTLFAAGALAALAFAAPSQAQQTITLSGQQSAGTCTFSGQIAVTPSGGLTVTCLSVGGANSTFGVSAPSQININTTSSATLVTRVGGTGSASVTYQVTGGSCNNTSGTLTFADNNPQPISITTNATQGSCTVAIAATSPDVASPSTATISVTDPSACGGPTNPCPIPGCPAPGAYKAVTLGDVGSQPTQLRLNSGQIASFPVQSPAAPNVSINFTQGQQAASPATTTEFSVSPCPGVIFDSSDTTGHYSAQCYYKNTALNYNQIAIYTAPRFSWTSQATLGTRGCWAPPPAGGQMYVNLRWTFSCPLPPQNGLPGCGFSVQWTPGSW